MYEIFKNSFCIKVYILIAALLLGCGKIHTNGREVRDICHNHSSLTGECLEPATTDVKSYSTNDRNGIKSIPDSTDFQDCIWRKCEISEGPLSCEQEDHACDMYRNQCIPICEKEDCCDSVDCPEGTVCVPALGLCGIPAGEGCYDLGTDWWSGRDIPPERRAVPEEAKPAVFEVFNDSEKPLYLISTPEHKVRFDLYLNHCGRMLKLPLAVNHFCPTLCPEQGPPMEIDCDQPLPIMQRLPAGERLTISWSGLEQVGMWRFCDTLSVKYCMVDRVTLPGEYTLEICVYTEIEGGQPDDNNLNRIIGSMPAGESRCFHVDFGHPTSDSVAIHIDP